MIHTFKHNSLINIHRGVPNWVFIEPKYGDIIRMILGSDKWFD